MRELAYKITNPEKKNSFEVVFTYDEADHQVCFTKANSRFGSSEASTEFFTKGGFGAVETLCMKIIEGMQDL